MLKISYIKFILLFIILFLLQVLILNNVSVMGYAVPIIYSYFVLKLPIDQRIDITLLLSFILGFSIDIFVNTPGINAAALTLVAFLRKPIMKIFFSNDHVDGEPSAQYVGIAAFIKYSFTLILIHVVAVTLLESFSILNWEIISIKILGSTLLSTIIIFGFEGFSSSKKNSSWQKI